jgi:hypothetical protein
VVLEKLDLNKDGLVSPEELEKIGLDGLPNFEDLGAEGHHYDVESGAFPLFYCICYNLRIHLLRMQSSSSTTKVVTPPPNPPITPRNLRHLTEEFHSTPETQTDESYNHPEDLEHFAHHEHIEHQEAEKEASYQGIAVDELIKDRVAAAEAAEKSASAAAAAEAAASKAAAIGDAPVEGDGHQAPVSAAPAKPGVTRVPPPEKLDPSIKYADARAKAAANAAWGNGEAGYKAPAQPEEKMRRGLPYKVRPAFRKPDLELRANSGSYAVQIPTKLGRFLNALSMYSLRIFWLSYMYIKACHTPPAPWNTPSLHYPNCQNTERRFRWPRILDCRQTRVFLSYLGSDTSRMTSSFRVPI